MTRDSYYRSLVDYESDYDKIIDMIMALNPATLNRMNKTAEEFACIVVQDSIRHVLFGDCGAWSSTGGCLAARASNNPSSANYRKVILAYNGPFKGTP